MLQANYIRENKEDVVKKLAIKNMDASNIIDSILMLDDERKKCQKELLNISIIPKLRMQNSSTI